MTTKKRRPKKRYTNREQIIERINKFAAKARRKRDEQRAFYAEAGQLRRLYANDENEMIKAGKKEAAGDKLGRQADRLEQDVLLGLRRKLAEFDTEVIPGITTDRSVQA